MLEKFKNIMSIPELRKRIGFTLGLLIIVRLGAHVPVPGINVDAISEAFKQYSNTLFGLYDLFSGGAFQKATLFALGIMPYISASIIIQLMGVVVPYFQRLQKEGDEGRKKITQITRYGTVLISALQAYGIAVFLQSIDPVMVAGQEMNVVHTGFSGFRFIAVVSLVTGTIFIMWLGEQITERGIGNGISLIIMVGIVARIPMMILTEIDLIQNDLRGPLTEVVLMGIMVVIVGFVVLITQGTRKIPVQYAKRVVGHEHLNEQ
ncbi:MAG TPA: preprotein translocase subunit SecY [Candidatus Marinimicrobia bacterium]|nr:preprotein translocase subunit SecY [Candidatus Neomarinimicrobiota bacterium]